MTEDRPTPPPPPPYPTYGQPQPARHPAWFWILVIGGCCAAAIFVLLILAAVAIPSMLRMRKLANQTAAVQTLRAINQAELVYSVSYPGSGFGCPLSVLGGDPKSGAPTAQTSQLIDPVLAASGQKSGYAFTVTCGSKTTINNQDVYNSVEIFGVPQAVGETGDRGFCSDERGVIKFDPDGGVNCTQPVE